MVNFKLYETAQSAAKAVHASLFSLIDARSTEKTIAEAAAELLRYQGITDTWYHGVPAFVLLGSRSCESISGRDYEPSDEQVGETNLVTVDLSPMLGGAWGDCARSFFVENGRCTRNPESAEFQQGAAVERELHKLMIGFVTPNTLFSELYEFGNREIRKRAFENLDFLGNLGHSIETDLSNRRFIDKNCSDMLGSTRFFTFEPHIRRSGGEWGFKHENIYYFDGNGRVVEL